MSALNADSNSSAFPAGAGQFATTHWSVVLAAKTKDMKTKLLIGSWHTTSFEHTGRLQQRTCQADLKEIASAERIQICRLFVSISLPTGPKCGLLHWLDGYGSANGYPPGAGTIARRGQECLASGARTALSARTGETFNARGQGCPRSWSHPVVAVSHPAPTRNMSEPI